MTPAGGEGMQTARSRERRRASDGGDGVPESGYPKLDNRSARFTDPGLAAAIIQFWAHRGIPGKAARIFRKKYSSSR
jgi:hypothetical protein